jgi:Flp pilus assembly protein TadB
VDADRAVLAVLALAAALAVWTPERLSVAHRLRGLHPGRYGTDRVSRRRRSGVRSRLPTVASRRLLAAAVGMAVAFFWGGIGGVVAGLVAGAGADWWLRRSASGGGLPSDLLLTDLPVACDLLAVCLEAGTPPAQALAAVAGTVQEPLRTELRRVAGHYRLGAAPNTAWSEVAPPLAGLARVMVRAGESGSSVVAALRSVAAEVRADARGRAEAAVRRAGVWVLAPLGACFLPAFLCLGVVPLVLGIAKGVFG